MTVLIGLRDREAKSVETAALKAAADLRAGTPQAITFAKYWALAVSAPSRGVAVPLPECTSCGLPAPRTVSEWLLVCPGCGAPWVPKVFRHDGAAALAAKVPPNAEYRAAVAKLKGAPISLPADQW